MVSAVGGAAVRAYATPAAPADSQAQLQRLQHQLSDNVNCASAKTREGKATITAIEQKIAALKDRIDGKPGATPARPADAVKATAPTGSTSGNLIDTYA